MDSLEYFSTGRALLAEKLTDSIFLGASLILPRIGCYREKYVALLFKNLRSCLATKLAYFKYKNTHYQDGPLPSLEVFAVVGYIF